MIKIDKLMKLQDVRYIFLMLAMNIGCSLHIDAQDDQVKTTDSTFIKHSRPIIFKVNKIFVTDEDRKWITDSLIPELKALGKDGIVIGRAAASPEGPSDNNLRLANNRKAAVNELLNSYGISTDRIRYDVVPEDYQLTRSLMWLNHDKYLPAVDSLMWRHYDYSERLKYAMKHYDNGKLWRHLLDNYFSELRAVRIMAIDKKRVASDKPQVKDIKLDGILLPLDLSVDPTVLNGKVKVEMPVLPVEETEDRREWMSIKTNLLFDFAYMPGYDRFCPIPNVAVEFYPLHGHFTYGASFDCPWWQDYDAHKYFQVRNYQIHTCYYLRSGDIEKNPPGKGAAFKGLYFSAYAHAGLYDLCFGEKRGWEGEGFGGGLGIGYVVPLGKKEHWRLEFGLQAGYFYTLYDPYQWRCPIDPDADNQVYYYKWYGEAKDFQKRKHRYTWLGPTRVEITLSYDLLYRRNHKKGVSFKSHELRK